VAESVPLEKCLSKASQELLASGAGDGQMIERLTA